MKLCVLIDNPLKDKELVEPLIRELRKIIDEYGVQPCLIEFENGKLVIKAPRGRKVKLKTKKRMHA